MSSSTCSPEPCILWGVSAVLFGIGCFLLVLALLAKPVTWVLLALINLVLKQGNKGEWCEPITRGLLTPSIWFLRLGCVFGFYVLVAPNPVNQLPITLVFFYITAVPFCVMWCIWTHFFLQVVANIAVDEFAFRELNKAQQRAATKRLTQVEADASLTSSKSSFYEFKSGTTKQGKPRSARATSLSQVLLIFRVLVLIVVLLICTSILGFDLAGLLNKTAVWWFVVILALVPHLRSIYMGTMFLFLYTEDEWNCTHLENHASLNWMSFITGDPSLARVKLKSVADGSVWVVPHSHYMDQFGMSEVRSKAISIPLCVSIPLSSSKITASELRKCLHDVKQSLATVHPSLSLHEASNQRSGFVTYDPNRSELLVHCVMFTTADSAPALRGEILATLLEVVRPWSRGSSKASSSSSKTEIWTYAPRPRPLRLVDCVPETEYSQQAKLHAYCLLDTLDVNAACSVTRVVEDD